MITLHCHTCGLRAAVAEQPNDFSSQDIWLVEQFRPLYPEWEEGVLYGYCTTFCRMQQSQPVDNAGYLLRTPFTQECIEILRTEYFHFGFYPRPLVGRSATHLGLSLGSKELTNLVVFKAALPLTLTRAFENQREMGWSLVGRDGITRHHHPTIPTTTFSSLVLNVEERASSYASIQPRYFPASTGRGLAMSTGFTTVSHTGT